MFYIQILKIFFVEFFDQLPKGSAFKLHPGFYGFPREFGCVRELLSSNYKDTILLCDRDTFIEAEMILEPKVLYGPRVHFKNMQNFLVRVIISCNSLMYNYASIKQFLLNHVSLGLKCLLIRKVAITRGYPI